MASFDRASIIHQSLREGARVSDQRGVNSFRELVISARGVVDVGGGVVSVGGAPAASAALVPPPLRPG